MAKTAGRSAPACLAIITVLTAIFAGSATGSPRQTPPLAIAEQFVDAFYSFKPQPLSEILAKAGESQDDMLFYQGWARGGNYIVMERMPCVSLNDDRIRCSVTVQDDLVLALGIGFDVTDTFTLTVTDGAITAVETSSNDPQLYHDARDWVWANRSDWVEQACKGNSSAAPNPGQCVKNMLRGYREYARLHALTPRAGS